MNRVVLAGSSAQRRGRLYSHDLPTLLVGVMQVFPRHRAMARIPPSLHTLHTLHNRFLTFDQKASKQCVLHATP